MLAEGIEEYPAISTGALEVHREFEKDLSQDQRHLGTDGVVVHMLVGGA